MSLLLLLLKLGLRIFNLLFELLEINEKVEEPKAEEKIEKVEEIKIEEKTEEDVKTEETKNDYVSEISNFKKKNKKRK